MLRFAHIGDIHIGKRPFGINLRYQDFVEAWVSVLKICNEKKVDFIIIAGDLADSQIVHSADLLNHIIVPIEIHVPFTPIYIISGNHDAPPTSDSTSWSSFFESRRIGRVQSLDNEKEIILMKRGIKVKILGMPWKGAKTKVELERIKGSKIKDPKAFNIFVGHMGVTGTMFNQSALMPEKLLQAMPFDYIALAHTHKRFSVGNKIFNPGSTETWSWTETSYGNRGLNIVTINDDLTFEVEEIDTPKRPYCRTSVANSKTMNTTAINGVKRAFNWRVPDGVMIHITITGKPLKRSKLVLLEAALMKEFSPVVMQIKDETGKNLSFEQAPTTKIDIVSKAFEEIFGKQAESAMGLLADTLEFAEGDSKEFIKRAQEVFKAQ